VSLIAFPTRPSRANTQDGLPMRADACTCGPRAVQLEDADTCHRCGHYPAQVIDLTWQHQARQLGQPVPPAQLAA
jgi:hypothetical protein